MTLPLHWRRGSVAELIEGIDSGKNLRCEERPPTANETGIVKISAVTWGTFDPSKSKTIAPGTQLPDSTRIKAGDLLISRANTLELVGATVLVEKSPTNLHLSDKVLRLRAKPGWAKWLNLFLNSPDGRNEIESRATGNQLSMRNIGQDAIRSIALPIPPLAEQRRIVARIEALFARIRRARADLECIASLSERLWYTALSSMFSEDTADHVTTLGELVVEGPQNGYSPATSAESKGTLALRLTATTSGKLDLSPKAVKRLSEIIPPGSRYWLRPVDLLIQRANALEHIGAAAVYQGPPNTYIYPDLMMRVRLSSPQLTEYLWRFLNSPSARQRFREQATGTAGNMPKINSAIVRSLPVPMVTPDRLLAVVRGLAATEQSQGTIRREATRARVLLDRLEQSILTRAFRGELVSQDSADEPARLSPTPIASHPRRRRAAPSAATL